MEPLLERAWQRAALQEGRAIEDIEAFTQNQMAQRRRRNLGDRGRSSAGSCGGSGSAGGHGLGHRGGPQRGKPHHGLLRGCRGRHRQRIMTLNGMQESGVQQHFAVHHVIRIDSDSDSAPRAQPAPRVRARAARQQPSPFGLNPAAAAGPVQQQRGLQDQPPERQ